MSPRMKSFFTPKGSAQSEKVDIAELTEFYHSIKHHISYVAQDCSLKVLKQVINDSDIVKQMTGGRTKCTALVNQVLFPYSMEPVQEDLKNDVPFSVATDASNKDHEVEKFTKNATNAYHRALAYIEKWYPFENQNYKTFSCLNLECGRLPTLDQLLELWSISPWKQQTPPEQIYDKLAALQSVFPSLKLEGNSIEMWCKFFQKEEAPNLLKIVQFVCSVPVSIAFVERIFSAMGNEHILKGRERFEIGMTSNILSPVEKMSSEHLATEREKLEYLLSIKDQLDKLVEKNEKAYKEIEKDKYVQHYWHDIKRVVDNTMSVLQQTVDTELTEVFGNVFDIRTNRFDEE
ncbi:dimer_Tnp_hAT domain-containing protein [Trichonephila clavipes]|nr:dimer_Tnp_hAT domain-containing protein [Trichonephila clavipes]